MSQGPGGRDVVVRGMLGLHGLGEAADRLTTDLEGGAGG